MIPKTKSDELIERLNAILDKNSNELELRRILTDIKSVENSGDYSNGKMLHGMYAAIVGDIPSIKRNFEAAIGHSGESPELLYSYMVSLDIALEYIQASNVADKVFKLNPDDISTLHTVLNIYLNAFNLEGASKVINRLESLGVSPADVKFKEELDKFNLKNHYLTLSNIDWKDVCNRTSLAASALVRNKIKTLSLLENFSEDNLFLEFELDVGENELIEADLSITETLALQPFIPVDNYLSFSCAKSLNA